jgi:stress-induced morphogen
MSSIVVVTPAQLEAKLRASLNDVVFVRAEDLSDGCGAKFEIEIVSADFAGKPLLAQHRMVHKVLEEERQHIHALTLKTRSS